MKYMKIKRRKELNINFLLEAEDKDGSNWTYQSRIKG